MQKKRISSFTSSEKAILEVLCYFGVFNYPVGFHKICSYSAVSGPLEVHKALSSLAKKKLIEENDGLYWLKDITAVNVKNRSKESFKALARAQQLCVILEKIPWIRLFAVTGSVAAFNKNPKDDIDVFIVTQANRLWVTRLFVYLILKVLSLYRTEQVSQNKICTNLLVDEKNSSWAHDSNIYVAHEIVSMIPLINKNNAYFEFLNKNAWVKDFFPNFVYWEGGSRDPILEQNKIMDWIEHCLHTFQLFYMRSKKTTETALPGYAHFKKTDNKSAILSNFSALKLKNHLD